MAAEQTRQKKAASLMEGLIREEVLEQGGWRVFWRFFPYLYPVKDKALLMVLMTFIGVPLTQISVFMGRNWALPLRMVTRLVMMGQSSFGKVAFNASIT